jgi:hypothetical protein
MRLNSKAVITLAAAQALKHAERDGRKASSLVVRGLSSAVNINQATVRKVTRIGPDIVEPSEAVNVADARARLGDLKRLKLSVAIDRGLRALDSWSEALIPPTFVPERKINKKLVDVFRPLLATDTERVAQTVHVDVTFEDGGRETIDIEVGDRSGTALLNAGGILVTVASLLPLAGRLFNAGTMAAANRKARDLDEEGQIGMSAAYRGFALGRRALLASSFVPFAGYAASAVSVVRDLTHIAHAAAAPTVRLLSEARAPQ